MTRLMNVPVSTSSGSTAALGRVRALIESTKPGITRMVTVTSGVGFVMAVMARSIAPTGELAWTAAWTLLGTALTASGANALNQWMERDRDARMPRTRSRPLPSRRATPTQVAVMAVLLCFVGLVVLLVSGGFVPMTVALVTILTYLFVYTPLKPVTPAATVVGAVPGALPPLIGWSAAQSAIGWDSLSQWGGWSLFLLMFAWQHPHFLAIAWMYVQDYRAGGYRVLPAIDPSGRRTARAILMWTLLLVIASLLPAIVMQDAVGPVYFAVALVGGGVFTWLALRLASSRQRHDARRAFLASVIYLPVLLLTMVAESVIGSVL